MKKLCFLFLLAGLLPVISCQNSSTSVENEGTDSLKLDTNQQVILIYNFFGKHRCPSCIAIEEATIQTLNSFYFDQVKEGAIKRYSINIDDAVNASFCEKYQAFGSGILITKVSKGKETTIDLTGDVFKFALRKRETFVEKLQMTLDSLLKI